MPDMDGDGKRSAFVILVRHFFTRFFESEELSPHADGNANLGATLGLIATPGAILAILLQVVTLSGWGLVTFRYFFVAYSMAVLGLVTVLRWDALFPDRRDYVVLAPLPVRAATVFFAKAGALALYLAAFLAAANLPGTLFWPAIDRGADELAAMGAHAAAVVVAGLFAVLAAATVQGLLISVLTPAAFRRLAPWVQGAMIAIFIMFLFLTPLVGHRVQQLVSANHAVLYWFPGFWFIGLYEQLRPATASTAFAGLGNVAIQVSLWTAAAFLLTYIPAYRRNARRMIEPAAIQPIAPSRVKLRWSDAMQRTLLSTPVERGVFAFIGQTIARSPRHRVFLAGYAGFGASLGFVSLFSGDSGLLRLPLTLAFILVSGLRAAFNFPSELQANWAFQLSGSASAYPFVAAIRKWVAACAVAPLFTLLLPFELYFFEWPVALFHTAFGISTSLLLTEVMFAGFRKAPFTCSYFPGKTNLVGLSVIYVFGFTAYSRVLAGLEAWLSTTPAAAGIFFIVAAGAWWLLDLRDRYMMAEEAAEVEYEDTGDPAVRTLGVAAR
jgi:hypothetical protein